MRFKMDWKLVLLMCFVSCDLTTATCWNTSLRHDIVQLNLDIPRRYGELKPELILTGPFYQIGEYMDCLYKFEEQYCMTEVVIKPANESSTLWQKIKKLNSVHTNYRRDLLYIGLCVPLKCMKDDVIEDFEDYLHPAADELGVRVDVTVKKGNCQTNETRPYGTAEYVAGSVCLMILLMVACGTSYDIITRMKNCKDSKKSTGERLLMSFSVVENGKRLGTISESEESKSFRGIQGIRAISMYLVLGGHVLFMAIKKPLKNPEFLEESYQDVLRTGIFNGQITMGAFLCVGGFLLAYLFLKEADARGSITALDILKAILLRYVRLTPAFAMVILLQATWFERMGSGPLWHSIFGVETENCQHYWWTNLLYINNYVYNLNLCLPHTWYLAVDFQCYIASLFVLIAVWKYPRHAKTILAAVLIFWIIVPFVQTYVEELDPVLLSTPENVRNFPKDKTCHRRYISFHGNAGAYTVGVIFGYMYYNLKRDGVKVTKKMNFLMWSISLTVPWAMMLVSVAFYQPTYKYNVLIASTFASLEKVIYAAGIGTIVIGMALGYIKFANTVASWTPFQIMGRLAYSVYLVHGSLIFIEGGSTKHAVYINEYLMFLSWFAHVVLSTAIATILVFLVELPSSALVKTMITASGRHEEHMKADIYSVNNNEQLNVAERQTEETNENLLEERV